jgi:hypothetical protein
MVNLPAVEGPLTMQVPGLYSPDDLSTKQFRFVKLDATIENEVHVCTGITDLPLGVLLNNPNAGSHESGATGECQVLTVGVCKVVAGEDLSGVGPVRLGTDANGAAVRVTVGPPTYAMGILLNGAASGGICTIILLGPSKV